MLLMLSYSQLVFTLVLCFVSLSAGIYILYRFKTLFRKSIQNEWLRINVVALLMFECLFCTVIPVFHDFQYMASQRGISATFFFFSFFVMLNVIPTVNAVLALKKAESFKRKSFSVQQAFVFVLIILIPTIATLVLNYYNNHYSTKYFKWAITYSVFASSLVGIGYLFYSYAEFEQQQLLQARQLENSRLNELKVKAELDVLHAKVNPHFLYNALNAIADLTITDGKKARQMTIALSDLFRYTINYSNTTFSTVKEEVEMAETYLQIEKIRFEENLEYKITIAPDAVHLKLPRFLLQPVVENAVKHGLSGIDKKGEILIEVGINKNKLEIRVFDNGLEFPKDLMPGYGLKIVYDKLKILYSEEFEVRFVNQPKKHFLIVLNLQTLHEATV